jgi:Zn-dependent peptidase ImmA (M78 family)
VENLQEDGISFRALTKMTAIQRTRAIAAAELGLELGAWVESQFELPQPEVPDLHLERTPATAAATLRAAWGLGDRPVFNLIRLLEAKGIRVFSLAEHDRALDGFSFWKGGQPFIFLNTMKSAERSRFDAAHELAHLVLHRHGGVVGRDLEREAMDFASAFLMPESTVRTHAPYPPSVPTLIQAKRWWGVALTALIRRMYDLEMITRWYYRAMMIQVQKLGYRDQEPDPMQREMSHIWPAVFGKLRDEGTTRRTLAETMCWPLDELKSLVFQLVLSDAGGGGGAATPTTVTPPNDTRKLLRLV